MTAAKSFNSLKRCLAQRLAPCGFVARGDTFLREVIDAMVVLEIQKDRKRSSKEEILFTINVGISLNRLRTSDIDEDVPTGVLLPESCHWRERLGRLLVNQSDTWWAVSDEQSAQSVCHEVGSGLVEYALPKVIEIASSNALIQLWKNGYGQGLTEFERRSNLARLLCVSNRPEEARAAIDELEQASLGKSWENSAKFTANELRKLMIIV
jgi:hypothetical protein